MAQAPSGNRAGHRSRQARPPHGSLLAQGEQGDALHAVLCAAGFNIRWLTRAIARLGLAAVLLRLQLLAVIARAVRRVVVPSLALLRLMAGLAEKS